MPRRGRAGYPANRARHRSRGVGRTRRTAQSSESGREIVPERVPRNAPPVRPDRDAPTRHSGATRAPSSVPRKVRRLGRRARDAHELPRRLAELESTIEQVEELVPRSIEKDEPPRRVLPPVKEQRPDPEELVERADPSRERDRTPRPLEQALDPRMEVLRVLDLREVRTGRARVREPVDGAADHPPSRLLAPGRDRRHDPAVPAAADLGAEPGQLATEIARRSAGGRRGRRLAASEDRDRIPFHGPSIRWDRSPPGE